MNNNYKPMLPNNPIKFMKKKNTTYTPNEYKINELYKNIRNNKFKSWMNSPLQNKEISLRGKYKGSYIYDNDKVIKKKNLVYQFLEDIKMLLNKNGYEIDNNKQFRDEIASFIYRQSK
tara:strand:+ start:640 stop:993 length:354 start_codon:yes stop_codon:yes gene_type:complete